MAIWDCCAKEDSEGLSQLSRKEHSDRLVMSAMGSGKEVSHFMDLSFPLCIFLDYHLPEDRGRALFDSVSHMMLGIAPSLEKEFRKRLLLKSLQFESSWYLVQMSLAACCGVQPRFPLCLHLVPTPGPFPYCPVLRGAGFSPGWWSGGSQRVRPVEHVHVVGWRGVHRRGLFIGTIRFQSPFQDLHQRE